MATTEEQRLQKNAAIKEKGGQTRVRHRAMFCHVVTVKIVMNKLNSQQREALYGQFREAKWIYNSMLNLSNDGTNIFTLKDTDFITVGHLTKDREKVTDEIKYLSRREVQSIVAGVKSNIVNLAKAKAKGLDVGSLRFISDYNSIDLAQHIKSYKIVGNNKIKVDKIRKPLRVRGLNQLGEKWFPNGFEHANAKLLKKADGFYIALTVYAPVAVSETKEKPLIGIDMGCETTLTLSDGRKYSAEVKETERLKRLQGKLSKCKKGSNNRYRIRMRIRKEYEHISNMRDDMSNKLIHMLSGYTVVMQDEQLQNWSANGHGKKVSHGVLGSIKDVLVHTEGTIVLSKWVPTTKLCTCCGEKVTMSQKERTFVCPKCGHSEDRDIHAAKNMLWFAEHKNTLCVERTEYNHAKFVEELRRIFPANEQETPESSVQG